MKFFRVILILTSIFIAGRLNAQFYVNGDDPGHLRWNQINTERYQIIYPSTIDSLAHVYARNLERYKLPISLSTTYTPGEKIFGKKRMPVVLHAYNAYSNGSVAWAPKRVDLYTLPSPYGPEAIPWSKMLSIHESRHITQMQFGLDGWFKPGDYIFGEMFNILSTLLYTGLTYMEGDAVVMETALTDAGRGRRADFLNYYMLMADKGIRKSWYQWETESQKNFSPNYYSLGYMTLAGYRYRWDDPDIMDRYYRLLRKQPYRFNGIPHLMEEKTGLKFKDIYSEIYDITYHLWLENAEKRKPYIGGQQITKTPFRYTDYSDLVFAGGNLYAIKQGFLNPGTLVQIGPDGKEKAISRFATEIGMLYHSPLTDRIYWSETVPDARWSLKAESKVRYMDLAKNTRKYNLTNKGLYYNPVPSPTENHIAVTEYTVQGRSRMVILDGKDGKSEHIFEMPDSLQLIESAWIEDQLFASALSDSGYGIYRLDISILNRHDREGNRELSAHEAAEICQGEWKECLAPQPTILQNLSGAGNNLLFTSDRSGTNEFYLLDPESGQTRQLTSTRYGVTQGSYSPDMKDFYYTAITEKGNMIYRIAADSLLDIKVDYSNRYLNPIAEKLSAQEKKLAEDNSLTALTDDEIEISKPERYRKFPHMFNVHSWAPVYLDVKNIMNLSYDHVYDLAALGVTGIMQNRLSTAYGNFGYSAHKDPMDRKKWRHSGHVKFTYSGLYPVFELELDVNDRAAMQFRSAMNMTDRRRGYLSLLRYETEQPYVRASLKTYIPWNFSSGGWHKGFIPQLSYTITNDRFDSRYVIFQTDNLQEKIPDYTGGKIRNYADKGNNKLTQKINLSARIYSVLATPNSCIYPRWGIGAEVGVNFDINKADFFSNMGFIYLYGYLPGIVPQQGIKLSALYQGNIVNDKSTMHIGSPVVNLMPRGLSDRTDLLQELSIDHHHMVRLGFDYAIPIYIGDICIGKTFMGIKRLELTPHFDFMVAGRKENLFSAGATLAIKFNRLFWIAWPCSIGVTYSYNGGSLFRQYGPENLGHHYVGPIFSVSF